MLTPLPSTYQPERTLFRLGRDCSRAGRTGLIFKILTGFLAFDGVLAFVFWLLLLNDAAKERGRLTRERLEIDAALKRSP